MLRDSIIQYLIEDGTTWKGPWDSTACYVIGDLVENNGNVYISIQDYCATPEPGVGVDWQIYWNLFNEGTAGTSGSSGASGTGGSSGTSGLSGDKYTTDSTTTIAIDATCNVILEVETGLSYSVGQDVIIAYDENNKIESNVISYDPVTGIMVVCPFTSTGSGTYSEWNVSLSGTPGPAGSSGSSGTSGSFGPIEQTSSDGVSSTTVVTFQEKLTFVTSALEEGTYRIGWSAEASPFLKLSGIEVRVRHGATIIAAPFIAEEKGFLNGYFYSVGNFYYPPGTISGAQTIDIYFRAESAGDTVQIRRARIEIWRVS